MKTKWIFGVIFGLAIIAGAFAQNQDVSISIMPNELTANPYEIAVYDINIQNKGTTAETYTLSVKGIPDDWYSLSHESLTLSVGESKTVYLFITPQPTENDIYIGLVSVEGTNASETFRLNIVKDHLVRLSAPSQLTSCLCEEDQTMIVVENIGKYSENLELTLSGDALDIIDVELKSFTIEPGEIKQIPIRILPVCDADEKTYNLEISIKSTNSYTSASIQTAIQKKQCYDFQITYPEEVRTCGGVDQKFQISVRNTGVKKDNFEVNIEEIGYSDIINIEPGQEKILEVSFVKEEGIYEIPFKVSSSSKEEQGLIRFMSEKCYGVELELDTQELTIQAGTGKLTKPSIKNTGSRQDTFGIMASANWIAIRPENLTLSPNESQTIFVYYSPEYGASGEYNVQLTAESGNASDTETVLVNVESQETTATTIGFGETTTTEKIPEPPEINITEPTGMLGKVWEKIESLSSTISKKVDELKLNKIVLSLIIGFVIALAILVVIYLIVMRG